jgi:hypothetical protein
MQTRTKTEKSKTYRSAIGRIDNATTSRALEMLGIMESRGLGETWTQPDLVLQLLHMETTQARRCVEDIIGKPITVGPPSALLKPSKPIPVYPRTGDDRRVLFVRSQAFLKIMAQISASSKKGRVLTCTPIYERLGRIRRGLTIEQLLARGVRRKDLAFAQRRGWLQLESE